MVAPHQGNKNPRSARRRGTKFPAPSCGFAGGAPGKDCHGQADQRVAAADLHGRVHRKRHIRRNPAPLSRKANLVRAGASFLGIAFRGCRLSISRGERKSDGHGFLEITVPNPPPPAGTHERNSDGAKLLPPSAYVVLNFRDAAPPSPRGALANATPRRFPLRLITRNLSSGI
jgi:hypothetical protein